MQGSQQGRWLSPDPAGAGWNQYAYSTNPNSETDPLGLGPGGGCTGNGICYTLFQNPQGWTSCSAVADNGLAVPCAVAFGAAQMTLSGQMNMNLSQIAGASGVNSNSPTGYTQGPYQLVAVTNEGDFVTGDAASQAVINGDAVWDDEWHTLLPVYGNIGGNAPITPANNCQAPFLCNPRAGGNLPVVQRPPTPKPLPHVNLATCMEASLIGNAFGNDDKTFATLGLNVAAVAKLSGGAAARFLPGPGWIYAAVATVYDLGIIAVTYSECKE